LELESKNKHTFKASAKHIPCVSKQPILIAFGTQYPDENDTRKI